MAVSEINNKRHSAFGCVYINKRKNEERRKNKYISKRNK